MTFEGYVYCQYVMVTLPDELLPDPPDPPPHPTNTPDANKTEAPSDATLVDRFKCNPPLFYRPWVADGLPDLVGSQLPAGDSIS